MICGKSNLERGFVLEKVYLNISLALGVASFVFIFFPAVREIAFLLALSGGVLIVFSAIANFQEVKSLDKRYYLSIAINLLAVILAFFLQQIHINELADAEPVEPVPAVRVYTEKDFDSIEIGDSYAETAIRFGEEGRLEFEEENEYDGKLYQTYSWGDADRGYIAISVVNGIIDYKTSAMIGEQSFYDFFLQEETSEEEACLY